MTELFAEANQGWDLAKLYQDISTIKGMPITDWEKTCLRGLLCRYSPKAIAAKTYWTSNSLRTELSRRLYPCIAHLTRKERIVWHKIADDLASMGYQNLDKLKEDIAQASCPSTNRDRILTVSAIINTVMQLSSGKSRAKHDENIINMATKAIEEGNRLNRSKNYPAALDCYHLALKSSATVNINVLINIARCYDRLRKYSDSLAICYFALNFIPHSSQPSTDKCKVYNFIAGAFHELAITHRDQAYLNTSIDYYERAVFHDPIDILPIWNQIDLILYFVKEQIITGATEKALYIKNAHQKMELLLQVARQGDSYGKYRTQVLEDMWVAFMGLDSSWQQQYHEFQNINI
jgi:tetratricopeptide (TPR) repeat protein